MPRHLAGIAPAKRQDRHAGTERPDLSGETEGLGFALPYGHPYVPAEEMTGTSPHSRPPEPL